MEQPRVQIQNESRSEMINTVLACGKCMKDITTSGECECHELFIASGDMEFYRRYFLCLIKHFIRTGVPNLTPLDGNIAFGNDTNGATDTYHYAANGLKAEFGPWDSSDIDGAFPPTFPLLLLNQFLKVHTKQELQAISKT